VASLGDDQFTRRQMMAALLAGGAGAAISTAPSDDDQLDEDALPLPESGPAPPPLVNRPAPKGYSPPYGPPPYGQPRPNMLAAALAGGAMPAHNSAIAPNSAGPAAQLPPGAQYAQLPGPPLVVPSGQNAAPSANPLAGLARALGFGGAPAPAAQPAVAPPAATVAQNAAQESDGTQPQVTAEQAEIYRTRQGLRTQEQALRAQIAGATNPDIAKIYADQLGRLSSYDQQLETAYLSTIKPKTRLLDESELTKAEKDAGWTEGQIDAAGNRSQVGGTEADTTRAPNEEESARIVAAGGNPALAQVTDGKIDPTALAPPTNTQIQTWQAVNADRATRGEPPIALNDMLMERSQVGRADRPLMGINGQPVDEDLTGDALFKAIPAAVANHAKAIAEIREKWPTGTEQARQPQLQQALVAAQRLDNTLNQQTFQTRQSMKNSAESGSGRINVANLANNTALFHSNSLANSIVALNNSNNTALNAVVNSGAGPAGGIIPGAVNKADAVKQFDVDRNAVSNELERSFHGVGTTAEQAVKRQIDDLSVNDAPQTQLGALKAAQDLLKGKITANEADYRETMGDMNIAAWERDHGRPFGFITPAAQAAGDRVAAMYENVKSGKGFHGFETPQTPSQRAEVASPTRNVAPQVTGAPSADPLAAARDAIAKGAPRDKVIQRLQQNGINPGGL
jgi:hypothetical protein